MDEKYGEGMEGMHTARVFSYHSSPCLISSSVVETENFTFTFKHAAAFYLSSSYGSACCPRDEKKFSTSLSLSLLSLKRIVPRETENSGTRHYPMTILSVFPIYIYPCPISWLAVRSPAYHQHRNVRFGSRPNVTT